MRAYIQLTKHSSALTLSKSLQPHFMYYASSFIVALILAIYWQPEKCTAVRRFACIILLLLFLTV